MKKLSEIYDLFKKGELKTGDTITFLATVSTKKETNSYCSANFSEKNILIPCFFKKNEKPTSSSLFKRLKLGKTFVIKGAVCCYENEFCINNLLYVNGNEDIFFRLKYLENKSCIDKLCSYLSNGAEEAAKKYFINNKENILSTCDSKLIYYTIEEDKLDKRIANESILTELLKANFIDDFGETCLTTFIMTVFQNADVYKNVNKEKMFANVAKYLYRIIDDISDDVINTKNTNGDNVINLMCCNDILSPVIEKLLKRNVSFDCVNDIGFDSFAEAIIHGSKTIAKLIANSGKVKITDEHKKLAEKYFIELER